MHQPQVGQREQRRDLSRVLLQPAVSDLREAELLLDHPERMFNLGSAAGLIRPIRLVSVWIALLFYSARRRPDFIATCQVTRSLASGLASGQLCAPWYPASPRLSAGLADSPPGFMAQIVAAVAGSGKQIVAEALATSHALLSVALHFRKANLSLHLRLIAGAHKTTLASHPTMMTAALSRSVCP